MVEAMLQEVESSTNQPASPERLEVLLRLGERVYEASTPAQRAVIFAQ
jgi:hypothetical protein